MENKFQYLEFEGIQVAAFIEAHSENEHSGYHPNNILFSVQQLLSLMQKQISNTLEC